MNFELRISPLLTDAHRGAICDVNQWRGQCVDYFARVEAQMVAAMEEIIARPEGAGLQRPSLFGLHYGALKNLVAADGRFAIPGRKLREALAECHDAFAWRNILIHAFGRVLIDDSRAWVWHYQFKPCGEDKQEVVDYLTQDQAEELRRKIRSSCDRLKSRLDTFVTSLPKVGERAATE